MFKDFRASVTFTYFCDTSMARTPLEPRKYVRDRGNHSARSGEIIGISFRFSLMRKYVVFSH